MASEKMFEGLFELLGFYLFSAKIFVHFGKLSIFFSKMNFNFLRAKGDHLELDRRADFTKFSKNKFFHRFYPITFYPTDLTIAYT